MMSNLNEQLQETKEKLSVAEKNLEILKASGEEKPSSTEKKGFIKNESYA